MRLGPRARGLSRSSLVSMLLVVLPTVVSATHCSSSDDDSSASNETGSARGAVLYADTCALCHGANGEGYAADGAPSLRSVTFLESATDEYLARSIARGRPGTTMSAWSKSFRGPYDADAIEAIVAHLRSLGPRASRSLPPPPSGGDALRGSGLYAERCASCHGATGIEGPNVRLANAEFLDVASDAFLAYAIAKGRPGTPMTPYEDELAPAQIADLVALLRSWQKPVAPGSVPLPGTFGPVVLNEGGPEPTFVQGTRFTPVDTVKAELDRGAAMVLLDARPPSDYVASHIAGATSVPFYETAAYASTLPRDRWIVCYCACPHAESGRAMDDLLAAGFSKVTILDEGFLVWRDRGYPVRPGADP